VFSSNKKQYVNILKQNKQLNLDYVILQDKKILKQEQSSFLVIDNNMPQDALFKLDTLQKNIPNTYLSSLFEGNRQKVIPTKDVDVIGYEAVRLDSKYSIVAPKNEITSAARYFANSGIDYIVSPFIILYEYIQDKSVKNSLNVLIYNNILYVMILNDLKQIVSSEVKELTPFEQVSDKSFSDDEIVDQKLYEEVHFLEIQQFLNDMVQQYYSEYDDVEFLEQVKILYTLKPLSDEQINSIYETIMVDVSYESIEIGNYLAQITQKDDVNKYSFIDPRIKKQNKNTMIWVILALVSILAVGAVVYNTILNKPEIIEEKVQKKEIQKKAKEIVKKEIIVEKEVEFPNHIFLNNRVLQDIYMLFDIVPYDAILKDLEINKANSTYVCIFTPDSKSLEDMQVKLLNVYKDSKVLLKHQNKTMLNTIIENEQVLEAGKPIHYSKYDKFAFLSIGKATEYLNKLLLNDSIIKFIEKESKEYLVYKFSVKSVVKTPKEFFDFIEKVNNQNISILLDYPIVFSKLNEGIEIKYNLLLNQNHKKTVELKK